MPTIDKIIQGITLGTTHNHEAEAAFARRFEELVALPVEVSVGGAAGMLRAVELTPVHGRARALFVDDGGGIWRVSWDAVRMPEGTVGAGIIAAYRGWLGYEVDESDVANLAGTIVSTKQVDERLGDIDRRIAASFETLGKIDLAEAETWLGDDDPWGRNRKYWSKGAERFVLEVTSLDAAVDDLEEVVGAGFRNAVHTRVASILVGLEDFRFEFWCPDDVSMLARRAISLWLACLPGIIDDSSDLGALAEQFSRWISIFEISYGLGDMVADVQEPFRGALIRRLEAEVTATKDGRSRRDSRVEALRRLYEQNGELRLLAERLPLGVLDENDVVAVMAAFEQEGDLQRAIDIGSDWLKQTSEESYRPAGKVERARRRLIGESGGAGEALNEAWQAFEEQPSAEVLDELREVVGSDERPEIDRKAAQIVGDDAYLLMSIVSQTEPGDALARAVADLAINELRDISSWTLRQAAERLDAESPGTGWAEAAVQV